MPKTVGELEIIIPGKDKVNHVKPQTLVRHQPVFGSELARPGFEIGPHSRTDCPSWQWTLAHASPSTSISTICPRCLGLLCPRPTELPITSGKIEPQNIYKNLDEIL